MSDGNFVYGDGFEPWQRIMLRQIERGPDVIGKITKHRPLNSEEDSDD